MKEHVIFKLNIGIGIEMYLTKENQLRVYNWTIGEEFSEIPYKIHKEAKQKDKEELSEDVKEFDIGEYHIKILEIGYQLFRNNGELVYTSEIGIQLDPNGTFVAIESEWDRVGLVQHLEERRIYAKGTLFYGMGEAADTLLLNQQKYCIYHEADLGNQALLYIPFYFTRDGFSTYYNANGKDTFEFSQNEKGEEVVIYRTKNTYLDYYFMTSQTPKTLISQFYEFSQSNSLLPRWAFGYIQSKFGYESEEEIYDLIHKFEHYKIPVSAIVIDLHWYKQMGDLDWDESRFLHHKELYETMKEKNIKMITISQPYFTKDCLNYDEFDKEEIFAKRIKEVSSPVTMVWGDWWCRDSLYGSIVNPIAPNAKKVLGSKYVKMKEQGLDGFWLDLGEPENVPPQAYFNQYPEEEFHLYFAQEWIKIIYEAVREKFPNDRIFILSRCGYTGTAGNHVSIWSGDSSSTFKNLEKQIVLGLNAGLTGYSYWGSDAGGFLSQLKLANEELYIRWMQFACFTPIFRTHGKKTAREPWAYGGKTTVLMTELIRLRYELIPYIYTTAFQTYKDGIPMMRPMFLEHPEVNDAWFNGKQYYFGDSLVVAPIYKSMEQEKIKKVQLPAGLWYDFYTYEPMRGGEVEVVSRIDRIPIFLKAGAIVIMKKELLVTEGENPTQGYWYIDDGESNDYQKGEFELIQIKQENGKITFTGVKEAKKISIRFVMKNGEIRYIPNYHLSLGESELDLLK